MRWVWVWVWCEMGMGCGLWGIGMKTVFFFPNHFVRL